MTYDLIEPRPEPTSSDIDDPDAYNEAINAYEKARERIADAVREYTEVVEDNKARYKIRAVVPFRVTAYRHDFDDHRVDQLRERFGRTPPGEPTDGFVDVSDHESTTYRPVPFSHKQEWAIGFGTDDKTNAKEKAQDALAKTVYAHVADGHVSVPITVTVLEDRRVVDGTPVDPYGFNEGRAPERDDTFEVETVERDFRVGEATYKVDAIVDPDDWVKND
jgi:hypothetical protein